MPDISPEPAKKNHCFVRYYWSSITFLYLYLYLCLFQPIGTTMFWTVSISVHLSPPASLTGSLIIITWWPRRLAIVNTVKQLICGTKWNIIIYWDQKLSSKTFDNLLSRGIDRSIICNPCLTPKDLWGLLFVEELRRLDTAT